MKNVVFCVFTLLLFIGCNPFGDETSIVVDSTNDNNNEATAVAIKIMNASGGAGNEVDTATLLDGQTRNLFAISVDDKGNYVADISVSWSLNNSVATITQSSGTSTTLIPGTAPGNVLVTASHNSLNNDSTGSITVDYTPNLYANLELWLKADHGITKDGSDLVSDWNDLSGNNNHASQSGADRPLFVTSAIGGQPALRFDGSSDYMETVGSAVNGTDARTIFIVATNISNTGTYNTLLDLTNTVTGSGSNYAITVEAAVRISGNRVFNEGMGAGETKVVTVAHGSAISATGINLYLDGIAATQASAVDNAVNTLTNPIWIGQAAFASSNCNCDIAEIIIYSDELSPTDRQDVEDYLANKYGL